MTPVMAAAGKPFILQPINTMATFSDLINSDKPVVIDFYADWCGPCRMMPPILKEVKKKFGDEVRIVKIDVDKNQSVSMKYGIRSIPTLMIAQKGEVVWRHTGVASAAQIGQALNGIGIEA